MAPRSKLLAGPSRLSSLISSLSAKPSLSLQGVKSLRLTFAAKNDHFGARHFSKKDLPRIQYVNPSLEIVVERRRTTVNEKWSPEIKLEFEDGKVHTLLVHEMWSTAIVKQLMDLAGGRAWEQYKAEQRQAGLPIIPGEENEDKIVRRISTPPPSFSEYYASGVPPSIPPPDKKAKKLRVMPPQSQGNRAQDLI